MSSVIIKNNGALFLSLKGVDFNEKISQLVDNLAVERRAVRKRLADELCFLDIMIVRL